MHTMLAAHAEPFEGRIQATSTWDGQTISLLYSAGPHCLRVENTATNWPNPIDLLDYDTGVLTLLLPNNRSLLRLPAASTTTRSPGTALVPGTTPTIPLGIGPQPNAALPGAAPIPPPSSWPAPPTLGENLALKNTGQTTNILGYLCTGYELKQRGETMTIWATEKLLPFQVWIQNQTTHFGPRQIEDQWAELLKARKLFPLLAILKLDNGPERYRFEVQGITPKRFADSDAPLFQAPGDYQEIQPLPF
jgi:hypothetical protein